MELDIRLKVNEKDGDNTCDCKPMQSKKNYILISSVHKGEKSNIKEKLWGGEGVVWLIWLGESMVNGLIMLVVVSFSCALVIYYLVNTS